jgi:cholestenol delta-isomerase
MFDHYILDRTYTRPEAAYFWGYFVFMNSFWIVIPFYLMCSSVGATRSAFETQNRMSRTLNGSAKKRL